MNNDVLTMFGKFVVGKVRDDSISCLFNEIRGDTHSQQGILMREMLSNFNEEQIEMLIKLVPTIVDTSLHYFLDMIDSSDEIRLLFRDNESEYVNIKELSDGLAGELYSEDGWIAKFSKEPPGLE